MRIASMAPGFAVEWLNIDSTGAGRAPWLPGWDGLAAAAGDPRGGVGAIETSLDRRAYGAAVAVLRPDSTLDVWAVSLPTIETACEWLAQRDPAIVLAGLSLEGQIPLPVEVVGSGLKETRKATPALQELVRLGRVRHDHDPEVAQQVAWSRVTRTEYGDVLSAKASDGPMAAVKAACWATWHAATVPVIEASQIF